MSPVYADPEFEIGIKLHQIEDCLEGDEVEHIFNQETGAQRGWQNIKNLLKSHRIHTFSDDYLQLLVQLSIKLAGIYYSKIRLMDNYFTRRTQLKDSKETISLYREIISRIFTNKRSINFNLLIDCFERDQLWVYEKFCIKISDVYVHISNKNDHVISEILDNLEEHISENQTYLKVKSLLHILTEISNEELWPKHEVHLIIRLLNCHIRSIETKNSIINSIEVCIRKILGISSKSMLRFTIEYILETYSEIDLPDADIKKIEYSIQIATILYKTDESLLILLKYDTLINILTLIASDSVAKCIFGNETFQNIIDTKNNVFHFKYPKIFFMKIFYNIKNPKTVNPDDLEFLKKYRKELHLTFLSSIIKHRNNIKIITNIYTSICLLMSEIPSEYTAAFLVCLVMNMQKYTLANEEVSGGASHRIHAVVISIMSLVCWLTEAKMLYTYLNKVLKLRAYSAPFLNPPLKPKYTYANHYVLWNKPDLFFENFEVRYALWKRFRLNEKLTDKPNIQESKKKKKENKKQKEKEKNGTKKKEDPEANIQLNKDAVEESINI